MVRPDDSPLTERIRLSLARARKRLLEGLRLLSQSALES